MTFKNDFQNFAKQIGLRPKNRVCRFSQDLCPEYNLERPRNLRLA